jgi:hypothetical protein
MNPSCMQLKAPSGWFAAGAEVQRAAMLLSDGAFKLFVWLCLHAERDRGSLHVTACDLATAIRKNEDDIRICLVELVQADVCYFGSADLIVIHDSFWPYTRTTQPTYAHQQAERYVAAVKRISCPGDVCQGLSRLPTTGLPWIGIVAAFRLNAPNGPSYSAASANT